MKDYMDYTWLSERSDLDNRDKVRILRSLDQNLMAAEISRILGLSRERIRQLLKKLDLETDVRMGRGYTKDPLGFHTCMTCKEAYKPTTRNQKYCSRECYQRTTLWWIGQCEYCSKEVRIRESLRQILIKRGHSNAFCGRPCYSNWRRGKTIPEAQSYQGLLKDSL